MIRVEVRNNNLRWW